MGTIQVKETLVKAINIKGTYMDNNKLLDEDGSLINIQDLLQKTFSDGTELKISVKTQKEEVDE